MRLKCPDCNNEMVQVRKAVIDDGRIVNLYPKPLDKVRGKLFHEYRFYCSGCGKEWVHNALWRELEEVCVDSNFFLTVN